MRRRSAGGGPRARREAQPGGVTNESAEAKRLRMSASFPYLRMRRGRSSPWMRAMLAENRLHPSDFIWPLFICEGRDCKEPIGSLPGVSRWSVDRIGAKAKEAAALGIPCVALFPNTP